MFRFLGNFTVNFTDVSVYQKIDIHFAFNLQVNSFVKVHKVNLQSTSNFCCDKFATQGEKIFFFKS